MTGDDLVDRGCMIWMIGARAQRFREMGIDAVPVIVIDNKLPLMGAPDKSKLAETFTKLLRVAA